MPSGRTTMVHNRIAQSKPPPTAYAASTLKGTDLGSSSSGPWIFFNSSGYRSCGILLLTSLILLFITN
jgi:hypothetical protein